MILRPEIVRNVFILVKMRLISVFLLLSLGVNRQSQTRVFVRVYWRVCVKLKLNVKLESLFTW